MNKNNFASCFDMQVREVVPPRREKYGLYINNEDENRENLGYASDLVTPKEVEAMASDLLQYKEAERKQDVSRCDGEKE